MARIGRLGAVRAVFATAALLAAAVSPAAAQAQTDNQLEKAGVCSRCHVISVVEWGISAHRKAGTNCTACHGESRGHVVDERNNVKPDRLPHGKDIAALCATCHQNGCPRTKDAAGCQTCHHVHALLDPKKPPSAKDEQLEKLGAQWRSAARHTAEGERLMKAGQCESARAEFGAALRDKPGDPHITSLLRVCGRQLQQSFAGFEIIGTARDPATGLPRQVRVTGTGIEMVLVPGGEADMGSESFAAAKPLHTVRAEPFYAGRYEVTQAEWKALMGTNPSAHQGKDFPDSGRMPVEMVSWTDAQAFLEKLNARAPAGGFRLPAEAEWELAARAGWPAVQKDLPRFSWFDGPERAAAPHPAGTKQPNALGLFDLLGNVWEWCSSLYSPYPYDAADGRESLSAKGLRVLRGGGYADTAAWLDPGARHGERPGRRLPWNGFRIARSAPAE